MSLTRQQRINTVDEFARAMELLDLSPAQIASDLGTTEQHIDRIVNLRHVALEDPWIVRNYLLEAAARAGVEPVSFTALVGDPRDYWFLDADAIERKELAR